LRGNNYNPDADLMLVPLLVAVTLSRGVPPPDPQTRADERLLAPLAAAGGNPAELLRQHSLTDVERQVFLDKIRDLGNGRYEVRQKATADLLQAGPAVSVLLRPFAEDPDLERRRRVDHCLRARRSGATAAQLEAAVRLVSSRPEADDASAVLLAFFPYAPENAVRRETLDGLLTVGIPGEPTRTALEAALGRAGERQAAAALVVHRHGSAAQKVRANRILARLRHTAPDLYADARAVLEHGGPTAEARAAADGFLRTLCEGNLKGVREVIALPFYGASNLTLQSPAEAAEYFGHILVEQRTGKRVALTRLQVARIEEHLRAAPLEELRFLAGHRPKDVRAVYVRAHSPGERDEAGALFVDLRGPRPIILGIGHAAPDETAEPPR
jgi:hypothetical protein